MIMKMNKYFLAIIVLFMALSLTSCKKKYEITFNTMGGSYLQTQEISNKDLLDDLPTPLKENFTFLGWFLDEGCTELLDDISKINKDTTLYAGWKSNKFTVTFDTGESLQVDNNGLVNKPSNPTKEGHTFKGWYIDSACTTLFDFTTPVTCDITLYAGWQIRTFTISYVTDDGVDKRTYEYGEEITILELTGRDDYDFIGWSYYGSTLTDKIVVKTNMTLYPIWEMKKESVKAYLDKLIPSEANEDLNLFTTLEDCSATFSWESSNSDAIDETGKVRRLTKDVNVELVVDVVYENETVSYTYNVLVKKIVLKEMVAGKIVSGYLYGSSSFVNLPQATINQLDYINYSFAKIDSGEIVLNESYALKEVLKYRNSGVRVGLAIGGWGAGGFSNAMLTEASRTKLVDSIMNVIKEYQFDGIDIDWEYPTSGAAGIDYNSADRENLTLFCKELKGRMLEYRNDLVLSIAVTTNVKYFDFTSLDEYIDYFNLMTYDYALGKTAYHDSSLYTKNASSSMDKAVNYLLNYVNASKIIPGAAFYGRRSTFASDASQYLGAALTTELVSGSIPYYEIQKIILNNADFVESYDEEAEAAYAIYKNMFYTYDNVRSVTAKCNYVKDKGLAGLMCWELTQDYTDENGTNVLVNAMYETLK